MAGDSHEDPGGDAEGEGKVVETHSRHASIEEESPSSSSPSPAPSDAPARRLSLPVAMPAAPDSVAVPPSDHRHRRLDTVIPVAMLAPQYHSGYRACPHRAHVLGGGPPCYLCSVLDAPPKYRRKEAKGWQRVKEKLALFSQGTPMPSPGGRSRGHEPPASVFTVSEWPPSNTPCAAPTEEVPAPLSGSPDQRRAQERDNPAFDAQDSVEGGEECRAAQLPPVSATFEHSFAPHPPALITNTHLPSILLPEDDTEERTTRCSRRMVCQLLYSFLLATASSTIIVNYDQPFLVIISVIVFLALFVFLPIIAVLECLFRCKMERDFRQYINGIMTSSTPAVTTPVL